jgi:hypothetical protein
MAGENSRCDTRLPVELREEDIVAIRLLFHGPSLQVVFRLRSPTLYLDTMMSGLFTRGNNLQPKCCWPKLTL